MPQILPNQALPSASVQNASSSSGNNSDSRETEVAGFALALDSALESPTEYSVAADDKSQVDVANTIDPLSRAAPETDTGGEGLPIDGNNLPLNTDVPPLLEKGIEVLVTDLELPVDDGSNDETLQAVPASPVTFSPLAAEIASAENRSSAVNLQSRTTLEISGSVVGTQWYEQKSSLVDLSQDQQLKDLQTRPQTVEELINTPARSGVNVDFTTELPIDREARVLSDKAGFAAGIESVLQAVTADSSSTLQSQSQPVAASAALAKLASVAEALPQESKMSPPAQIHAPLGSEDWGPELAVRMRWMLSANSQHANLKLNPAELGNIEIKISTEGDDTRLLFVVQHASAREAIEGSMPRLREVLEQSGLSVSSTEVEEQSPFHQDGGGRRQDESGDTIDLARSDEQQHEPGLERQATLAGSSTLINYYI